MFISAALAASKNTKTLEGQERVDAHSYPEPPHAQPPKMSGEEKKLTNTQR